MVKIDRAYNCEDRGFYNIGAVEKSPKACFKDDYIAVFLGKIEESYGGGYFKLREILSVAVHIGDGFHTLCHFRKGRLWDINAVYFYPVGIAYYIRRGEKTCFQTCAAKDLAEHLRH